MSSKNNRPSAPANAVMPQSGLTITLKPVKPLHVEIDLDALTFDDVVMLQKLDSKDAGETEIRAALAVITRVIGQDAAALPMRHLKKVIEAVMQGIGVSAEQGN